MHVDHLEIIYMTYNVKIPAQRDLTVVLSMSISQHKGVTVVLLMSSSQHNDLAFVL